MSAAAATRAPGATPHPVREHTELRVVAILAAKELRDSLRDRWLWLYGISFAVVAVGITSLAVSDAQNVGFAGFGRTAASLVALAQLVVPLMGLTIGARSVAGQRERGTLAFLLSHPVNPTEVYLGIYLGNMAALLVAVAGGFGVAGIVAVLRDAAVNGVDLLVITLLAWLLSVAMVGAGMLVSVFARRSATAMGLALVLWLVFVLLGNLGLMGTAVATRVSDATLFFAAIANPVEAFRLSTITILGGSLDVLGPVGTYAVDRFGDSVQAITVAALAVWAVIPPLVGAVLFRRSPDR